MFHNKEKHREANKEQTWITEKQIKIDEVDIKESTKEQNLETENDMIQSHTKSEIKLRNKWRFEPLSVLNMILISALISTVGAGKIRGEVKNEITSALEAMAAENKQAQMNSMSKGPYFLIFMIALLLMGFSLGKDEEED